MRVETGHDEGLAASGRCHNPVLVNRRRVVVVRQKQRQRSNIAVGAVRVFRTGDEPLLSAFPFEHGFGRIKLDRFAFGHLAAIVRRAGSNPLNQRLVIFAIGVEPLAARVRNRPDRLLDEQALFGNGEIQPPRADFTRQSEMIAIGIEAKQREPKTIFAACRPVAASCIAAGKDVEIPFG